MSKLQYLDMAGLQTIVDETIKYIDREKILPFPSRFEFPATGKENTLYIDMSTDQLYRWDDDEVKYFIVGFDPRDIAMIDGGNSN